MIAAAKTPTLFERLRGIFPGSSGTSGDMRRSKYDAAETSKKRRAVPISTKGEDQELNSEKRSKLITLTHDARRNMTLAAWAIRKHLDYVASFTFQAKTGDAAMDDRLESFVKWWGNKKRFDVAQRHPMRRWLRMAEAMRTVGGDFGVLKIKSGHVQAIEGDRIRNFPTHSPDSDWTHGVYTDAAGRALKYTVGKRNKESGFVYERTVVADNLILHGYFDRFDQIRGVSPLTSGLNQMRDVYEGSELALAKMKVAQLFALAIYSNAKESVGVNSEYDPYEEDEETEEEEEETEEEEVAERYKVQLGEGPVKLELDEQDRAEFLESKSPSSEFQAFTQVTIAAALKSLDIPFSFYDEGYTNFSGARQGTLLYEKSADTKRDDNRELLDELLSWRLAIAIDDGSFVVPRGFPIENLRGEWVSSGVPWLDPLKEINANIASRNAGFDSTPSIAKYSGKDAYQIADEEAHYQAYRVSIGLPESLEVPPGAVTINEVSGQNV